MVYSDVWPIEKNSVKSLKVVLTLSALTIFLTGCSFYAELYFINNTDEEVAVTILLTSGIGEMERQDYKLQLRYVDEVLEINDHALDQLTEKLEYEILDSMTIRIQLPPQSTTMLGGDYNGLPRQFETYKIEKGNVVKTMNTEELWSLTEKSGGAFPPLYFTYVIE